MILTPRSSSGTKGPDQTGKIISITKIEEMEMLLQDRNQKLQASLIEYKKQNIIRGKKGGKKPEIEIKTVDVITRKKTITKWECDKMEPGRTEIDQNGVFKMTIQTGDILQVNNKQRFTDEDKVRELADLEGKKAVERTEIQNKDTLKLGQEYICKFSFMIPEGFPLLANRLVIGQRKQMTDKEGASQNPFLAQKLNRNKLQFIINTSGDITGNTGSTTVAKVPIEKYLDKRINIEYQFKFSDKDDGYLKIKINGEDVVMNINGKDTKEYHGKLASDLIGGENKWTDEAYFKFGLYRDNYDYGIKVLKKNNEEETNENLEKEIADIEKAKEDEKNGNPMTIYFKDYSVEKNKE